MGAYEKLTSIANAMREKTGKTEKLSLDGMTESVGDVFEAGKKAEREAFWNAYITETMLADAERMFYGDGWGQSNFFPTRDIRPIIATDMFRNFGHIVNGVKDEPLDLAARLEECGVTLDLSNATSVNQMFQSANISRFPTMDFTNVKGILGVFRYCPVTTIDKMIVNANNTFSYAFKETTNLENVVFEGEIGNNIQFQESPLSHDSIMSIINHLAVVSGKTLTLGEDNIAKITADEINIATDKGWNIA